MPASNTAQLQIGHLQQPQTDGLLFLSACKGSFSHAMQNRFRTCCPAPFVNSIECFVSEAAGHASGTYRYRVSNLFAMSSQHCIHSQCTAFTRQQLGSAQLEKLIQCTSASLHSNASKVSTSVQWGDMHEISMLNRSADQSLWLA